MITLESINDPLSHLNVDIQKSIMNSHPSFNLLVVGKEVLINDEIIEDNNKNLASGEEMFHIKDGDKSIGLTTYLPKNPYDNHSWIGLLIIHKEHERNGSGSIALKLIEQKLMERNVDKLDFVFNLEMIVQRHSGIKMDLLKSAVVWIVIII